MQAMITHTKEQLVESMHSVSERSCVLKSIRDVVSFLTAEGCAHKCPYNLTPEQEAYRIAISLQHYNDSGDVFLSAIVTGDESWCHQFGHESKRQSVQWKHTDSPPPKKFRALQTSAGKAMLSFFFDHEEPLLIDLLEHGARVNAQLYSVTLTKLRKAMKSKHPSKISRGVILLHDNARPHTAKAAKELLQKFKWKVLSHPPYSPDLSPCDFHMFGELQKALRGQQFQKDDEIKEHVHSWFKQQPKVFFTSMALSN
ncbi:Mariner Mos1 transposase [Araneus ventricosus]|uniref:Mariner Mos1 transposase n=1 Tax=Araneus ventricosus TaxID=182803 RepID=A0A4Y2NSA6_ARAVE|nr:Mariner Mos1 transposase [Araneus ventricosus]